MISMLQHLARLFIRDFDVNIRWTETLYIFLTLTRERKMYPLDFGLLSERIFFMAHIYSSLFKYRQNNNAINPHAYTLM